MIESHYTEGLVIKAAADNNISVSGYASVFNLVDSHNDVIIQGAFTKSASLRSIKFLWQHDKNQPIGVVNSVCEDEYGLYVEATINSETQQGREAIALVKQGALNGLSIGFNVLEVDYNTKGHREITSLNLWEVSLVTFPSNDQARLNHIKNSNLGNSAEDCILMLDKAIALISQLNQL